METRKLYSASRRTRRLAAACVVVVSLLYVLSTVTDVKWWPSGGGKSLWIGAGSVGYATYLPPYDRAPTVSSPGLCRSTSTATSM